MKNPLDITDIDGSRLARGEVITITTGQLLCGDFKNYVRIGFPYRYLDDAIEQAQLALAGVKGVRAGLVTLTIVVEPFRNTDWTQG